jgi:hypothetical protein
VGCDEHWTDTPLDAAQREFERMDGELDAAIVFAVAAFENSTSQLGTAALSDAMDCYAKILLALQTADLTGAQLQHLRAKLLRLRQFLGDVAGPATNVAA